MSEEEHIPETEQEQTDTLLEQARLEALQAKLQAQEAALKEREEQIAAQERKGLLGALGVTTDEEAAKFEGKSNAILKELVEYKKSIKITPPGIPRDAPPPVDKDVLPTSDGLRIKQKLYNRATGEYTNI